MAKLIYSMITSLDGYISDTKGNFDWAEPDEEVHSFANELERSVGTHLYGRRLYETMLFWETADQADHLPAVYQEYAAVWKDSDKIVFSSTLTDVNSARTRIEGTFDPEAIERLKTSSGHDISIGGANLAAQAFGANLVDEYLVFLCPVSIGNGVPALPEGMRLDLELIVERRFTSGVVFLRYRVSN